MNRFNKWVHPEFDKEGWAYPYRICADVKEFAYGWRCQHPENLKLGKNTDIGCFTYMNAKEGIEIGESTQIGSHCSIYSVNTENNTKGPVKIGDECKIGSFSLILPNTIIEDNTEIKAYSIVLDDNGETVIKRPEYERRRRYGF